MQVFQNSLEESSSKLASLEAMYKSCSISNSGDSTKGLQEFRVSLNVYYFYCVMHLQFCIKKMLLLLIVTKCRFFNFLKGFNLETFFSHECEKPDLYKSTI